MDLRVRKYKAVDVYLNDGLVDKLMEFLKARKITMETLLSDAIPLFVLMYDESKKDRLLTDVHFFLLRALKAIRLRKFKLYFEKDSLVALKDFAERNAFDSIEPIINSSLEVFMYLMEQPNINGKVVVLLEIPEGKLVIDLSDYLKI